VDGRNVLMRCFIKHHAIRSHVVVEVQLHAFLTSALDGGDQEDM